MTKILYFNYFYINLPKFAYNFKSKFMTRKLITTILNSSLPNEIQRQAVHHVRYMTLHPNRYILFGFDDNATNMTKLFCWDRAPEGAMFWLIIFKNINHEQSKTTLEKIT